MKKFFMPAAGLALVVTAIAAVVLVLTGVRSAETPNLGEMDEDGAKVCVLADDCTWGEQVPEKFTGTVEIMPGVTLKQFQSDIQVILDALTKEFKKDGFAIIDYHPGGDLNSSWTLFQYYARANTKIEVRGDCISSCTLIVGAVDKSKICFGPNGKLHFHQARDASLSGDPVSPETTQLVFDRYPSDIQNWIGKAENLPAEGFWTLHAQDLWTMGYRKCDD